MLNSKVFVFFIHAFASHWPLLSCQTITSLQSLPSRVFHLLIPCVTRPLLHLPPSVFLLSLSCSENIAWGFSLSVATRSLPGQWLLCTTPKVMGWAFLSRCPCRGSREQQRGSCMVFGGQSEEPPVQICLGVLARGKACACGGRAEPWSSCNACGSCGGWGCTSSLQPGKTSFGYCGQHLNALT